MIATKKYTLEEFLVPEGMAQELLSAGWNFDWSIEQDKATDPTDGYIKVGAFLEDELQGLVKFTRRPVELFNYVHLLELAPFNVGQKKLHSGVAGTLFAHVALDSLNNGFEGFVVFEPKSALYNHYILKYGAKPTSGKLLAFNTEASVELIHKYLGVDDVS